MLFGRSTGAKYTNIFKIQISSVSFRSLFRIEKIPSARNFLATEVTEIHGKCRLKNPFRASAGTPAKYCCRPDDSACLPWPKNLSSVAKNPISSHWSLATGHSNHPSIPWSLEKNPYSLSPLPYSLFPIPYSLFPIPYSLEKNPFLTGIIRPCVTVYQQIGEKMGIFGKIARTGQGAVSYCPVTPGGKRLSQASQGSALR